jgi:hypothetical protein
MSYDFLALSCDNLSFSTLKGPTDRILGTASSIQLGTYNSDSRNDAQRFRYPACAKASVGQTTRLSRRHLLSA